MARFFVGQRVKKVRGDTNVGLTGRVIGTRFIPAGTTGVYPGGFLWRAAEASDLQVEYDTASRNADGQVFPAGVMACGQSVNFEPIQPEGMKPVSWHECLWKPEHIKERRHA